jgi:hypothetical protein
MAKGKCTIFHGIVYMLRPMQKCRGVGFRDMHNLYQALLERQAWRLIQFPTSRSTRGMRCRRGPAAGGSAPPPPPKTPAQHVVASELPQAREASRLLTVSHIKASMSTRELQCVKRVATWSFI